MARSRASRRMRTPRNSSRRCNATGWPDPLPPVHAIGQAASGAACNATSRRDPLPRRPALLDYTHAQVSYPYRPYPSFLRAGAAMYARRILASNGLLRAVVLLMALLLGSAACTSAAPAPAAPTPAAAPA